MTHPATGLPDAFLQRLSTTLDDADLAATLAWFSQDKHCTFRVNTLRCKPGDAIAALGAEGIEARPWPLLPEAFWVPFADRELLVRSSLCNQGCIYVQNFSSMVPVVLLDPQPGEEILDLAAAPGGKTLHTAARMADEGRIAAVELVKGRYYRMLDNIERSGATLVDTYWKDGARVGRQVPNRFDKVLLDAPCSSEARFDTRNPASYRYWSEKKVKDMQRKQKQLLYSGVSALKPGGKLVYSTCSYAPEENELAIQHILRKFGDQLEVQPIALDLPNLRPGLSQWKGKALPPQLRQCRRILPTAWMDGFFVAVLHKVAQARDRL